MEEVGFSFTTNSGWRCEEAVTEFSFICPIQFDFFLERMRWAKDLILDSSIVYLWSENSSLLKIFAILTTTKINIKKALTKHVNNMWIVSGEPCSLTLLWETPELPSLCSCLSRELWLWVWEGQNQTDSREVARGFHYLDTFRTVGFLQMNLVWALKLSVLFMKTIVFHFHGEGVCFQPLIDWRCFLNTSGFAGTSVSCKHLMLYFPKRFLLFIFYIVFCFFCSDFLTVFPVQKMCPYPKHPPSASTHV